ncbi:hypothetical protein SNE40_004908 [Patella caerulea]|uniref:Tc1-like transposase DDE domain-containing protein n=1 Tax=Patella caerulea TaxID=87958 RepID=A0AAN8K5P3_PATCE
MDAEFYRDHVLRDSLLPFVKNKFPDGHRFVQDNDPKHKSKKAQEFIDNNDIDWIKEWPSESCDLNPIEMVWNMLKQRISKRNPTTKEELVTYCNEFWTNDLTQDKCIAFIDHIYKVVPVIISVGGRASGDIPNVVFRESSRGKSI